MNKQFCPYCMSPIAEGDPCPSCGLTAGSYTPNRNHLPPGTILNDRYLIGRALGSGGFGITYIGCDLRLELKVAIKEYFPTDKVQRISDVSLEVSVPSDLVEQSFQNGKERFLDEARVMARMDKQPEIVSVRDFFECNNTAYIVMEYVEGTTFKQLVTQRGSGIPPQELLPMLQPLFGALTNLHDMGLIHRDISPDNLMMENGRIRLIDFGCARQPEKGEVTMTIILKHGYAPIEQYTNRGQGPWTDVYALSATIYFCLVGKTPPRSIDRALDDELILPRKLGIPLTEEQEQALIKGMGVTRRQRFGSVAELYGALYQSAEPDPDPVRVTLTAQAVCSGRSDLSGFVYELQDEEGIVKKTCCTDAGGKAQFHLTVNKDMAGGTYTYYLHQQPGEPQDVEESDQKCRITMSVRLREGQLKVTLQKDSELIMAGDPIRFVNHLKAELDDNRTVIIQPEKQKWWKTKKGEYALLGSAAVLVLFCLLMLPKWLGGSTEGPAQDQEEAPAISTEVSVPEEMPSAAEIPQGIFDNPLVIESDEEPLYHALALDEVSAISIRNCQQFLHEEPVLTKHLRVEAGAMLDLSDLTIPAGILLEVEGTVWLNGTLTVEEGGWLKLTGDGYIQNGDLIFMDQATSLSADENSLSLSLQHAAGFADLQASVVAQHATYVSNAHGLMSAANDPDTRAIVIDGEIHMAEPVQLYVPLVISEGSLLSMDWVSGEDPEAWLDLFGPASVLNYGRLEGGLGMTGQDGRALVVNYGELDVRAYLTQDGGVIVNHGAMASNFITQIFPGNALYNYGSLEVMTGDLNLCGGMMKNTGSIQVENRCLDISGSGVMFNSGEIMLRGESNLQNWGYAYNAGIIHARDTSRILNEGLWELAGGELLHDDSAALENNTVMQLNDMKLGVGLPGTLAFFNDRPWDVENVQSVTTMGELRAAIADETVGCIEINGSIDVYEALELDKNLIVNEQLIVHDDLSVHGAVHVSGTLEAGSLRIENGNLINNGCVTATTLYLGNELAENSAGFLLNYGYLHPSRLELHWQSALLNYGEYGTSQSVLVGNGAVIAQYGMMDLQCTDLTVDGTVVLLRPQELADTTLQIRDGGLLRTYGGELYLTNTTRLQIDESGTVDSLYCSWQIDSNVRVENDGQMWFFGYDEFPLTNDGTMVNNATGSMGIGVPLHLNWLIQNQGEIRLHYGEESKVFYGPNGLVEGNPLLSNQN